MYAFAIWQQLMNTEFLGILEEDEGDDDDVLWGKQHDVYFVYIPPWKSCSHLLYLPQILEAQTSG